MVFLSGGIKEYTAFFHLLSESLMTCAVFSKTNHGLVEIIQLEFVGFDKRRFHILGNFLYSKLIFRSDGDLLSFVARDLRHRNLMLEDVYQKTFKNVIK